MNDIISYGVSPALKDLGYMWERAHNTPEFTGDVSMAIAKAIEGSAFVIADISDSNPNVMYEIGIAEANMRPIVLISREASLAPFHLHKHQIIYYRSAKDLREKLTKHLSTFSSLSSGAGKGIY